MTNKIVILLTFLGLFFLVSCSDDSSTNPTTEPNYFPTKIGNYWVYENYSLDSTGKRITSTKAIDSIVIYKQETEDVLTIKNAQISVAKHFYTDKESEEQKLYYTKDALYQKFDQIPGLGAELFGIKIKDYIPLNWVLLIDFKNTNWTIIPQGSVKITDQTIPAAGKVDLDLNYTLVGAKGGTKQFTIAGKQYTANEYKLSFKISGNVILKDLFNAEVPISEITFPTSMYFVEGIGLVYTKTDGITINIAGVANQRVDGNESELVRFNVTK